MPGLVEYTFFCWSTSRPSCWAVPNTWEPVLKGKNCPLGEAPPALTPHASKSVNMPVAALNCTKFSWLL